MSIPAPLPLFLSVFLFLHSVAWTNVNAPQVSAHTLHSLLEDALQLLRQGDAGAAADRFSQLHREFKAEPELADPEFLNRLLPIQGQAEFAAGRPVAAAETLARFVDAFPSDPQQPRLLYTLATALRQSQQNEHARERFSSFVRQYPEHPLLPMAKMQKIQLHLAEGNIAAALDLLNQFPQKSEPQGAHDQARLLAIRHLSELDPSEASELLLETTWDPQTTPEIATLSMTAFELASRLQEESDPTSMLRLYRMVLPRERLIHELSQRITAIAEKSETNGGDPFLREYQRQLLERLKSQKNRLVEADDYTDELFLRRAEASLAANRPHEAWLIFEQLSLDDSVSAEIREQAHARWTIAASLIERWEEALTIARYFLVHYPDSPLAPETLSLIAQAHQEQRRYDEAIAILEELRDKFPTHPLAQRWSFTLGFNKTAREDYDGARADFRRATSIDPAAPLASQAELWHGLTFFFERDYENALTEFTQLLNRSTPHPLEGEIRYRLAATLYAKRDYDEALEATTAFLEHFQNHVRYGEALVLRGDIQMGAGQLDEALKTFESIPREMSTLWIYGVFQRGKIYHAWEETDDLIAHFTDYISKSEQPQPRTSEALYWIGRAHQEQGNPEKAVPFLLDALERFGNDPESREIGAILGLLEPLHTHLNSETPDFGAWLEIQRQKAHQANKSLLYARLTLHLSESRKRHGSPHQAEELLFEIALHSRKDFLGPDILGAIGHFLLTKNLKSAEEWFLNLLNDFPESPERAIAFHGLGILSYQDDDYENALTWFRRFQNETAVHPLAVEVFQSAGKSLLALGRHEEATSQFEQILELRAFRGRPHAEALMGLAETWTAAGNVERAIAYHQRVYTLHRAQPDLVAQAYFQSSLLFEQLGDLPAAHQTLLEMLSIRELAGSEWTTAAQEAEKVLASKLETNSDSLTSHP